MSEQEAYARNSLTARAPCKSGAGRRRSMDALLEAVCERSPAGSQPTIKGTTDDTGNSTDLQTDDSASSEEGGPLVVDPLVAPMNKDGTTSPDDVICQPATNGAPGMLPRPCAGARHPLAGRRLPSRHTLLMLPLAPPVQGAASPASSAPVPSRARAVPASVCSAGARRFMGGDTALRWPCRALNDLMQRARTWQARSGAAPWPSVEARACHQDARSGAPSLPRTSRTAARAPARRPQPGSPPPPLSRLRPPYATPTQAKAHVEAEAHNMRMAAELAERQARAPDGCHCIARCDHATEYWPRRSWRCKRRRKRRCKAKGSPARRKMAAWCRTT